MMLSSFRRCWSPSSPPSSTISQLSLVSRRQGSRGYVDWNIGRHQHASTVSFIGCPTRNQLVNWSPSLYLSSTLSSSSSTSALTEIKTALSKSLLSLKDEQMLLLLVEYSDKHGDCHVPVGESSVHREERRRLRVSSELVQWILQQRKQYARAMSPGGKLSKAFQTRLVILESMGFIWSTREAQWHRWFNQLVRLDNKVQCDNNSSEHHHEENSSSNNNNNTRRRRKLVEVKKEEHPSLFAWADEQRKAHKAGRLSFEREDILKRTGFVFSLNEHRWQENYDKLSAYKKTHGDSRVPVQYDEDPAFGEWIARQRRLYNSGELTADRIELLEKLDFSWDPYCDDWDRNYAQLSEFHAKHGHTRVPRSDVHLCAWVDRQRSIFKRVLQKQQQNEDGDMVDIYEIEDSDWQGGDDHNQKVVKRIALLKNLMFHVDLLENAWREHYDRLCHYKSRFGHVAVGRGQKEYRDVYQWIQRQRKGYAIGVLSKDRIEALEAIGFVWDGSQAKWHRSYTTLCEFQAEHGHCRLTESETSLINWVKQQRERFQQVIHAKNELDSLDSASRDQFLALQKIGFAWSVE